MFKRKKIKERESEWTDKAAGKIAGGAAWLQGKFAKVMGRLFARNVRTFFIVFCLSAGGYSMYLFMHALFGNESTGIRIDQATIPKHVNESGDERIMVEQYVDDETYRQLQGFKFFMDSLKQHKSELYDSIVTARPGLMDSVKVLEDIFNSQQKKEAYEK